MTVNTDIFRRAGVDDEQDERARRAVKAFRAMQPTLSAYARVLTKKKDARVEMAARDNGSTDGRRIFYRPPIALGDKTPHERALCDKRDERKQLLCPACAIREEVLVTIYHEIAHIAFDSFAKPSDADRKRAIEGAIKEAGGRWAKEIAAKIEALPSWRRESYMGLASTINEFFPYLVNCLEDARVNRELFKARQGVRKMFDADTWKIFTQGVEQKDKDGKIIVVPWNEYPLNTQVMVGTFCKASGYDYSSWFHPRVVEALNDEGLTKLINRMDTIRSAGAVYHLAFLVMARLRELGFLGTPADPDPETPEEENDEQTNEPQDADQPEDGGESPDSDPVSGQPEQESDSRDEPEAGEGEGSHDDSGEHDAEAESSADSDSEEESTGDGSPGGDHQDSDDVDSGDKEGDNAEDSDSDGEASDGGDSEGADADASPGGDSSERSDGVSEGDGQADTAEAATGEPSSEGNARGEVDESDHPEGDVSDQDSVPTEPDEEGRSSSNVGEDASADSEGQDQDSSTSEGSEPGDDALRGEGDIEGPNDGGTPEEANAEPAGDSDSSRGTDSSPEADPREAVDNPSESGSTEEGSSTDPADSHEGVDEGSFDSGDEDEAVDTGADDGYGGTKLLENPKDEDVAPEPPMGTPEEVETALLKWGDHDEKPKSMEAERADEAVDRAIVQGIYFTTPSRNIYGVREHHYGSPVIVSGFNMSNAWDHKAYLRMGFSMSELGITGDFDPPESILGEALMRMRVAFSDNKRHKELRHRKNGKVDARVLGRRAHLKDERLFKKRVLPGKKDYFVLIGMDISGSTIGKNIKLEKRAVMAQATLLDRLGVKFAIYAHSGNYHDPTDTKMGNKFDLDIYLVKEPSEVWDSKVKDRLRQLGPDSANIDGHALEYMRKVLDQRTETDRIILYYSDGKMPAENEAEELEILQREIRICKQKGYTLLGVGIRTDSPARHGLDTVQVDEDADVIKVVKHLEKRLLAK